MLNDWSAAGGMRTAFIGSPQHCSFILDRGVQVLDGGPIQKHDAPILLEGMLHLPCFEGPLDDQNPHLYPEHGIRTHHVEHTVVAALAHLGSTIGVGHYRAALRLVTKPNAWVVTEDGCKPELCWMLPRWFEKQVTVIWTTRDADISWPLIPLGASHSEQSLLTLLGVP